MTPSLSSPGENPLVSLTLISYKQEKLIREAVEAALAQTYSPLEIVFSDDCSPDRTFEIIQDLVDAYRGPHRIILNRNPKNLGICDHFQKALSMTSGQWIIMAAGDDISFPERVEKLMEHAKANPQLRVIASGMQFINQEGKPLPDRVRPSNPTYTGLVPLRSLLKREGYFANGCAMAIHRSIWADFPPIERGFVAEDRLYPFRGALLGDIYVFQTKLVKYRLRNDGAPPILQGFHQLGGCVPEENPYTKQQIADIRHAVAQGWIASEPAETMIRELMRYAYFNYYSSLARTSRFPRRMIHQFRKLLYVSPRKDWRIIVQKLFPRLTPMVYPGWEESDLQLRPDSALAPRQSRP